MIHNTNVLEFGDCFVAWLCTLWMGIGQRCRVAQTATVQLKLPLKLQLQLQLKLHKLLEEHALWHSVTTFWSLALGL